MNLQPALHIPEPLSMTWEGCEPSRVEVKTGNTHKGCNIFFHIEIWLSYLPLSAEGWCFWLVR